MLPKGLQNYTKSVHHFYTWVGKFCFVASYDFLGIKVFNPRILNPKICIKEMTNMIAFSLTLSLTLWWDTF